MPVYLFTYHAYGTWLPDKQKGYVRRHEGIKPPDAKAAERYREQMKHEVVLFDECMQRRLIQAVQSTAPYLDVTFRLIATDPTHLHVLLQWSHDRHWSKLRQSIRTTITRAFNHEFGPRPWLCEGASRKQVKDQEHLRYLEADYLPDHRGWKWCMRRGWFR